MSDEQQQPSSKSPGGMQPQPQRSGCATAFMVIVGVILLLPGLCALIFAGAALTERSFPSEFMSFIVVGLLVGFVGVIMIRAAISGPRSGP
jgi:amino acid transporter